MFSIRSRCRHAWATLAASRHVPVSHQGAQTALVRQRIKALAPAIAILILVWIPLEPLAVGTTRALSVLPVRLAMAGGLIWLARAVGHLSASAAVRWLVWLQALGFGAIQLLVHPATDIRLEVGYGLFPFVLTGQLAAFPLPWSSTLRATVAPAVLLLAVTLSREDPLGVRLWRDVLLFVLIAVLAAWSSHAQLRLLLDLLGARRDASTDPLTGLANRRLARRRLEAERARAARYGEPLSVLMLDLDNFKRVNDRWGHPSGDRVLRATARALHDELRGADLACRYGGEEFLAILPAAGAVQAMEAAERIRAHVGRLSIALPGGAMAITASIGAATWTPGEGTDALIARADAALYRAKSDGRDRCVLARHDERGPAPPTIPRA